MDVKLFDQLTHLTHSYSTRVAHTEPFCCLTTEQSLAGRRTVQTHIAHDDVVLRLEAGWHVFGRIDDNLPTG